MSEILTRAHASAVPVHAEPKDHFVRFYDDDTLLCNVVGDFLARGLESGAAAVVVASPGHRLGFEAVLVAGGIDVAGHRAHGRLIELDAEETLERFMTGGLDDGMPDAARFQETVGALVAKTAGGFPVVRAYGEMVDLLMQHGNFTATARLEQLWNELGHLHSFQLYCAYRTGRFASIGQLEPFKAICSLHSRVTPYEARDDSARPDGELRQAAELRQRALALEAEVAARHTIEEALREREREIDDFVDSASECLHSVGADGRVLWANKAELELLGFTREEYIGRHIADVHADPDVIEDILARLARGERLHDVEARLRAKDGSIKHVLISSSPVIKNGRFAQTRCFTRDITERKRAEETQARLAAIVESSDDAIVGKTLDGVITAWNRAAERMFGYSAAEAVGRDITLIIPEERRHEEHEVLARLRRGEKIDHFETVRRTKDGRLLDISLTVSPIRDGRGRIIGASKVARDITERRRAEAERQRLLDREQEARKKAERALQVKDEFLATVSHELRSPLNAIVGWTHLLRTGGLDADTSRRAAETIHRNAMIQDQLISDILDMQRLNSGKFRLTMRDDIDLALAVEAAIDTVRPAAQAKAITVRPLLEDVPAVAGDPDRIQQIIWNLLSNAVKFTPGGGSVYVFLREAGAFAEIVVEDTGPGIRPEFLPYVFERFRQDAATGGRKGGLGLGLAIVRNLAELHGGTVSAENSAGGGAVFTVRLPRMRTAAHVDAVTRPEAAAADEVGWGGEPAPSLHGTRVMVVDDEADAREVLATVLGLSGADVTVATSAADALALLARNRPDVLVCDIDMPGEDGYSLLRKVRTLPDTEGGTIPAAALTAATSPEDRLRALRAGFQIHIPKPVQPGELAAVVATLARRTRNL